MLGTTSLVAAPSYNGTAIESGAVYAFPKADEPFRIANPWPFYKGRFGDGLAAGADFFVSILGSRDGAPNGADGKLLQTIVDFPGEASCATLDVRADLIACAERPVVGDHRPGQVLVFDRRSGKQKPFYMHTEGMPLLVRIREWAKWTFRIDTRLRVHRTLRNGLAYWRARKSLPDPGTPVVYFPLHLQPEAQTSPMGGVFVDQHLAVEMMARTLPEGWVLLVKEHPVQRLAKRDYGFYERLGRIGNVRLVSRSTGTFALMEQCRAVATITGTAGWEALFMGKPVLVFGNAFYRGAPGTVSVDDPAELAVRLREIERGTFPTCATADLERFVCAVERCTEEGIVDKVYLRDSDLSEQQSINNYTAALVRLIERPETVIS